jgi:serine/threonine protein kinase/uncharacterized protein YecT (DUF1311 family)
MPRQSSKVAGGNAMPVEHVNALANGTRLNQYELVNVLGAGGFGITYMARDTTLDTLVAIKEYLPGDLAKRQDDATVTAVSSTSKGDFDWGLDRFLSEARTLAKFRHPNIVRVNQIFQANNTAYLVMEYAKGHALEDVLRTGPLTEEQTKDILTPIMDGLQRVHEQGFLHRDIKPANIIMRDDGGALLIDFGAARQAMESKSRTLTSIVTEGYAPLEQYHGTGHQGPWTDIYALGAVAYKCLTGTKPPSAAARVKNDPLVPIAIAAKGKVSPTFAAAIGAALRLDEQLRPQTIAEFEAMIAGTMEPSPSPADDATRVMKGDPATQWVRPGETESQSGGATAPLGSKRPGVKATPAATAARAGAGRSATADVRAPTSPASRGNTLAYLGVAGVALIAVSAAWYLQNADTPGATATTSTAPQQVATTQNPVPVPNVPPPTAPAPLVPAGPSASAPPPPSAVGTSPAPAPQAPPPQTTVASPQPAAPPAAPLTKAPPPNVNVATAPPPPVMTGPPPPAKAPAPPPVTVRASFNCGRPGNNAERMVCSDGQLAALDVKMAELYQLGLRSVADTNAFRGEQLAWLAQRDECGNRACLAESYGERIKELERWVGP